MSWSAVTSRACCTCGAAWPGGVDPCPSGTSPRCSTRPAPVPTPGPDHQPGGDPPPTTWRRVTSTPMAHAPKSHDLLAGTTLRSRTSAAVADSHLRATLHHVTDRLAASRETGAASIRNWEELRTAARSVRADIIARLPE